MSVEITDSEAPFLRAFFKALNAQNICYAVMRNWDCLPDSLGGSDLDLFAADENAGVKIVSVAREVATKHNGFCTALYRSDEIVSCWGGRLDDGSWWGLHIDIAIGMRHKGQEYISSEAMSKDRVLDERGFYRGGALFAVAAFLKEILCNYRTKKNYYELAMASFAEYGDQVRSAIEDCPNGDRVYGLVRGLFEEKRNEGYIRDRARRIEECVLRSRSAWAGVRCSWRKLRRLISPPSIAVAFLGTDGSGKSTLIDSVKPYFEKMLHSEVHYEHLRPNLLPSLARLVGRPRQEGPVTDPHGGKRAGWMMSLVRFFYYYVDYTLGYWVKIRPILAKRPTLVIFDRYYYEYMIDQRRCAVRLFPGFARFFSWFIPKPDMILCLGGEPEKIFARKPETSLLEVRRQVGELQNFCDRNSLALWINTTTGIDASRTAAIRAIMERMAVL